MTTIHGFTLVSEREVAEINTRARLFRHDRTGAQLLSLENEDENKSFTVGFQTPPADDTGLPHILEHSVLCGSRKYPVKDPFVQLAKTSLKTFLNAITFPDMTIYPVASTNLQDFYNLVNVYLDAVFFPRITPETLMQEGWHYETESADAPLIFKGVVFNEMKAAYSNPESALGDLVSRTLTPDTPYAFSSGGIPAAIPDLTYEQFIGFHSTYYHPSNAHFVFYGDDAPDERLRLVAEYIDEFEQAEIDSSLPLQPRFQQPVSVREGYDAGDADEKSNKSYATVNWLLDEITDRQHILELGVLSHVLTATAASPLRKALIESRLGEGLSGGGMDTYQREASFSIGLKGIQLADADKVEALVLDTLADLAENGIDKDTIAASLNTIEFSMRERNTGGFPRGLATSIGVLPLWMHGGDPVAALGFEERMGILKQRLAAQPDYLERMIGEHLLNNPHRVTAVIYPDPQAGQHREAAERARLDAARASMDAAALDQVIATQDKLKVLQETPDTPEALATIPTLTINDLERDIKINAQEIIEQDGTRIYFHEQPTSGIVYADLALDLRLLPEHLLPYVDLFGECLTKMGTTSQDFVALIQRIGIQTGGVGAGSFTASTYGDRDLRAYLFLRGKATNERAADLFAIFQDVLLTVNLDDRERFKQIVLEKKARYERFIPTGAHVLAASRVCVPFHLSYWADERISGVTHLFFLRELAQRIDSEWEQIRADLTEIRDRLNNRSAMLVNLTAEGNRRDALLQTVSGFLRAMPAADLQRPDWQISASAPYEGLTMPLQVNFNAKGASIYDLGYKLDGSISVILKHLNLDYMWQKIRVQGGAYGGRGAFSASTGVLTFQSWRDPNITGTLANFDAAADYLQGLSLSDGDLEKAIIGTIGDLDGHALPDAKGYQEFVRHLLGYDAGMRQTYRDQIFSTTLASFHELGSVLRSVAEHGRYAAVGSPEAIEAANQALGSKLTITAID